MPLEKMLDTLVKQLQKQGFTIVNKKGDKKYNRSYELSFLKYIKRLYSKLIRHSLS